MDPLIPTTTGSATVITIIYPEWQGRLHGHAVRVFLFGARDVSFVVGLPAYLNVVLVWNVTGVGMLMAIWVIEYGLVQGLTHGMPKRSVDGHSSEIKLAQVWVFILGAVTFGIAGTLHVGWNPAITLIVGLGVFGFLFAINSSLHSYLILALTGSDQVAMNVGSYYSANAAGRAGGAVLSRLA